MKSQYRLDLRQCQIPSDREVMIRCVVDGQSREGIRYTTTNLERVIEYTVPKDACYTLHIGIVNGQRSIDWIHRLELVEGDEMHEENTSSGIRISAV